MSCGDDGPGRDEDAGKGIHTLTEHDLAENTARERGNKSMQEDRKIILRIEDLHVRVDGNEIIHGIDLEVREGETLVLFGPNGSGKTTLLMGIMGFRDYRVTSGSIQFRGVNITHMTTDERARMGIGMMFQRPPTIHGVRVRDLVRVCGDGGADPESLGDSLQALRLLDRPVNQGFSGGEIKRSELLQLLAQGPELVLLDEPESGVDLESIALVGGAINAILERNVPDGGNGRTEKERHEKRHHSGLVITHTGYILDYVNADRGVVLVNGEIVCESNPREILRMIKTSGYEECERCAKV